MKIAGSLKRREFLGLAAAAAAASPVAASRAQSPTTPRSQESVRIYPSTPISDLTVLDARFARVVRDLLTDELRGLPSGSIEHGVRDRLDAAFGGRVTATALPPKWLWTWVVNHWELVCWDAASFEVRLSDRLVTIVDVDEIEPMG